MPSQFLRCAALAAIPSLMLVGACQPAPEPQSDAAPGSAAQRDVADALDRGTADARKARISELEYDVLIDVATGGDAFRGEARLRFDLADADSALTVDFSGGSVESVTVNGDDVEADYNGYFITLPATVLQAGTTEVRIVYTHPYSHDGNGLHRFVDPEDGRAYLYTYLWPYYANRLLPSFDQPNLKAPFNLRVRAPEGWTVISAAPGEGEPAEEGVTLWTFAATPPIATYMFSLHAGPYRVWQAEADGVPMRLLARQALADYVAVDEWFDITRQGMAFYREYFEIPDPFAKYDQVIAPEATIGGMENVAAVTYGEQFVQRQESDRYQREDRADVILHELAHMWFGDLVTHEWWNGMWLNEAFATQMATLAAAAVTEFDDQWHGFFSVSKKRAFERDSRVTTHPIEMPIRVTDEFHTVWDAITYQKGASALKQLQHLVGAENYRRGVAAYLEDNAWGNTTLADFIGHQERAADMDLSGWTGDWLLQPGFNTLGAVAECDDQGLRSLTITQTAPAEFPVLRTHSVDVALYDDDGNGRLVAATTLPVTVSGTHTAVEVPEGTPCPVIVNPNFNDWTFAPITLSNADMNVLRERLVDIADPLSRSIFLAALLDRTATGEMPLADYVDYAMAIAARERNTRVLEQVTASVVEAIALMQRLRPETDAALARLLPPVESLSLQKAEFAETQDLKLMWVDRFLGVVSTPAGLGTVRALLDGKAEIAGVQISPEMRWQLLIILSRHAAPGADELLDAQRARDPSDFGARRWLSAQAARPDPAGKAAWLAKLQDPRSGPGLARQRAVMEELFPPTQTALQFELLDEILGGLPQLARDGDLYFLSNYTRSMLTPMCLPQSAAAMLAALSEFGERLDATTLRFLREAHQADAECMALRAVQ